ncbi:MAG: ATP phosphoribosyltransferase regulatory subunit [Candidatus Bathyarchaeia archaeon]
MFTKLQTPEGTRDYLPEEVEQYLQIEQTLRKVFKLWGYEEIRSPTIEFIEALSTGVGSELIDSMFKFQDRNGKILALRAEMTTPVARIVASRMESKPKPLRLFYICNVFRYSQPRLESLREFHQAGVELIGLDKPDAEGEILALLISAIKALGLENVRVDLGHAGLLRALLNLMHLEESERTVFKEILNSRNTEKIAKFAESKTPPEISRLLTQLLKCKRLEDLRSVNVNSAGTKKFLSELLEINSVLQDYGIEKNVFFDFYLIRKIEYYTGVVFEVSIPEFGVPIGGGGRYNNLIEKFNGSKTPAIGFAVEIEKCLSALQSRGKALLKKKTPKILVKPKSKRVGIEASKIFRDKGIICLLNFDRKKFGETVEHARQCEIDYVVFVGSSIKEKAKVYDLKSNTAKKLGIEDFLNSLEGAVDE